MLATTNQVESSDSAPLVNNHLNRTAEANSLSSKEGKNKSGKITKFWKIGTINVHTMREDGKVLEVVKAIHDASLDIVGLQEGKRLGQGNIVVKPSDNTAYNLYWKGRNDLRQHGVGILIK